MPDDVSSLREFNDKLANFSDNIESIHKHSLSAGISFKGLLTSIIFGENALKLWDGVVTRSTWAKGIDTAVRTLKADRAALLASRTELLTTEAELAEVAAGRIVSESMTASMARQRLESTRDQLAVLEKQVVLDRVTRSTHPAVLGFYATIVSSTTKLYQNHQQIGRSMVEANSHLRERLRLTQAVLATQLNLGSEFHTTQEAAKALVDYGFDLSDSFERNLNLVVMMHDGLGMTLRTASELAAVYERQLNMSASGVADSISRVVNDTGLAADEAGRLAINLGRAVAMLRPSLNKDLAGVMELVGRYEGALQELGGQFGAFQDFLGKMTGPEGLLQAGILGVNNPEFLASKEATKQVVDQFAAYAKRTLGNAQGWDRALRLSMIAEQFGITAQQANLMIMAVDRANEQKRSELTLQERYDEQMKSSAQSFGRLKNSISALLQEAAIPLLYVIGPIANGIASLVNTIVKIPGAVHVVTAAFLVAVPFMVKRLIDVSVAFYQVAAAAHMAALRMQARAAAEAAGSVGGATAVGTGGVVARWLPRIGYTLAVFAALVGGWEVGKWLNKKWGADSVKFSNIALKESVEQHAMRMLRFHTLRGNQSAVANDIAIMRGYFKKQGFSDRDVESKVYRAMQQIPEFIGNARFAKESSVMSSGASNQELEQITRLADTQIKMVDMAEKQRDAALKLIEVERAKGRDDSARHAENERARRLNSYWSAPGFLLEEAGTAYRDLFRKMFK